MCACRPLIVSGPSSSLYPYAPASIRCARCSYKRCTWRCLACVEPTYRLCGHGRSCRYAAKQPHARTAKAATATAHSHHASLCPCLWLLQLACYDQGGRYTAHSDEDVAASPAGTSGVVARRYTVIYYPNDPSLPWEDHESSGGALRLWPKGSYEAISIPPVADRLVVFESHLTHEVQTVRLSGGRRCAFTVWYSAVG